MIIIYKMSDMQKIHANKQIKATTITAEMYK